MCRNKNNLQDTIVIKLKIGKFSWGCHNNTPIYLLRQHKFVYNKKFELQGSKHVKELALSYEFVTLGNWNPFKDIKIN